MDPERHHTGTSIDHKNGRSIVTNWFQEKHKDAQGNIENYNPGYIQANLVIGLEVELKL